MASVKEKVRDSLTRLKVWIEKEKFKGYDPYDALNSPLLKFFSHNSKYLRIAFTQTLKRLPINLRSILGIKKDYNPKGLGLFMWCYAKLYKIEKNRSYLTKIDFLLHLLNKLKSKGYSSNCWGYNFDWQSRAFFVPRFTPTIVNSSFIGHALIDTYQCTGKQEALDMAIPIKDFILKDLNRKVERNYFCFSYTPIDHYFVHNANLLGASLLVRLSQYTGDSTVLEHALASLEYSIRYQREDGSWFYSEKAGAGWIDSFHTGFNLQSIGYFLDMGFANEYRASFEKGVNFYAEYFFLNNGTPKYFHNYIYPIDIHCPSQAIVFFSRMGVQYKYLTDRILNWMILNMQDKEGYFYFRIGRHLMNRIPYIRWGQAWAFHALTEYLLNHRSVKRDD